MAFESLSDKLQKIMKKVKGQAKLTESNMDEMLREIRIALLEADVNYKVVKEFVGNVKEKALGQKVLTKLSPGQMIVKIVRDEITELLGSGETEIRFEMNKPTVIMLVGLQGTGKTTSAGKLARLFQKKYGKKVLMALGGNTERQPEKMKNTIAKTGKTTQYSIRKILKSLSVW